MAATAVSMTQQYTVYALLIAVGHSLTSCASEVDTNHQESRLKHEIVVGTLVCRLVKALWPQ